MYLTCLITYFTKYFTPSAVYASSQPKGKPVNEKKYIKYGQRNQVHLLYMRTTNKTLEKSEAKINKTALQHFSRILLILRGQWPWEFPGKWVKWGHKWICYVSQHIKWGQIRLASFGFGFWFNTHTHFPKCTFLSLMHSFGLRTDVCQVVINGNQQKINK